MVGGGMLSRRAATLSRDGKLILCPCGRQVHIYSATTGERVGALSGHTGEVTCLALNPDQDGQVYTGSLDATLRLWDFRSGECVWEMAVREAIKYLVIQQQLGLAYMSIQMRSGGGRVCFYNLKTHKFSGNAMKTHGAKPLALSPTGSLCATIDRHSLFVWRTGHDITQPLNLHHTRPYTCVAISSDDTILAAGDISGRILIWRGFEHHVPHVKREGAHAGKARPESQVPLTTVHWHAHPVGGLCFSPDNVYLMSGGQEGVMVMWQLESGAKTFLPRLGGAICGLHPSPADPARYLLRQVDNCLRVVNTATMKVDASVHGLRPLPAGMAPAAAAAATALLPAAPLAAGGRGGGGLGGLGGGGVLVTPCENSELQFYDVVRDRHLMLLQVAPRNAIAQTDGAASAGAFAVPAQPYVSHVAFSADGSVMATVDFRSDAGPYGSAESTLKFWDASGAASGSGAAPYSLNTRVDEPHRTGVSALSYHPRSHLAVTTGGAGDAEFKVWVREERKAHKAPSSSSGGAGTSKPGKGGKGAAAAAGAQDPTSAVVESSHWRCRSLGAYKGLPLGPAAFGSDGSVLAVAAHNRVTLWDLESNALAAVMAPVSGGMALTQLAFVPGTPYLAAASPNCLTVYNLLTASVHWCHPLGVLSLSFDAAHGLLAAAVPGLAQHQQQQQQPLAAPAAEPQQELQAQQPSSSCHVLVFDPRDPAPKYHCRIANAQHVQLMYVPPAGAAALGLTADSDQQQQQQQHCGASPLLVLRDSRLFSIAALQEVSAGPATVAPQPSAEERVSGFEAAFGPMGQSGPAPMIVDTAAAAGGGAGAAGRANPKWRALFDAPSHILPPPTALANAFLTLLTTADGDR